MQNTVIVFLKILSYSFGNSLDTDKSYKEDNRKESKSKSKFYTIKILIDWKHPTSINSKISIYTSHTLHWWDPDIWLF